MIGFTKSVAKELGSWGITCIAVAPGFIETEVKPVSEDIKKRYIAIPLRRAGPSEVANGLFPIL